MKTNAPFSGLEPLPTKRMVAAGLVVKRGGVIVQRVILRDPAGDWR